MALSLELTDNYELEVLSKEISYMLWSFCTSFSCNSIPCSGCLALHGVNPHSPSKKRKKRKNEQTKKSKLGAKPSKLDQGIFLFLKHNKLMGVIICLLTTWYGEENLCPTQSSTNLKLSFMWEQKTKKPLHLIASTSDRKKICQSVLTNRNMLRVWIPYYWTRSNSWITTND